MVGFLAEPVFMMVFFYRLLRCRLDHPLYCPKKLDIAAL